MSPGFHNPYTFAPTPPRPLPGTPLGDGRPAGHERYRAELWTGRLELELQIVTPLLVPDTWNADPLKSHRDHVAYGVRRDPANRDMPLLPPTGLKGCLRSAYEVITNSRFGVFRSHDRPLTYRGTAGRGPYEVSPDHLLDESLQPARSLDGLSPADRVFGWVGREGASHNAHRGQLRVHNVQCRGLAPDVGEGSAIAEFGPDGFPLAVLGQPRPSSAGFYAAAKPSGELFDGDSVPRGEAYREGQGLRGRKLYWHHLIPDGYWSDPAEDRTWAPAPSQEYRQPGAGGAARTKLNRTVREWIKPGARFTAQIDVRNLSDVELGALLWLLGLPHRHHLRLGGGKPLGFGSVRVSLSSAEVARGRCWAERLRELKPAVPPLANEEVERLKGEFKQALTEAYATRSGAEGFEAVPFIAAFLGAARGPGDDAPIRYPRTRPRAEGRNYTWFATPRGKHPVHRVLPARDEPLGD